MKVIWTEDARNDLERVYRFLAQVNERAAAKTHNSILAGAGLLASHPKLGKIEPLLDDIPGEYRSLFVGRNYKVIYKCVENSILIIAIFDCRRDPAALRRNVTDDEI